MRRLFQPPAAAETLHVTNGDSVIDLWRKMGLPGTLLAWKDILHEGPVIATMSLRDLSGMRATYLAHAGYGNAIKINYEFEKRDRTMDRCHDFREIVLWFEHDLYDQLQILQVLHYLAGKELEPGRVQMILSDRYLGMQSPEELAAMFPRRKPVSSVTCALARKGWSVFASDDPSGWLQLGSQSSELPYLSGAMQRLAQEFPSVGNGLSRTEQQMLSAVARGSARKEDIFATCQSQEEAAFLGDATFYAKLQVLCDPAAPLIAQVGEEYSITPLGLKVLRSESDWLDSHVLERWIGGVHLTPKSQWRWNEATATLLEMYDSKSKQK
ncbi:MAG: DUF1835 domain-containing protein [Candidatus Eremiobacteraeota bacterium]|nr:DUF1835 domain-containing protein [Candidatus Eremiobacteraeota bacterium]